MTSAKQLGAIGKVMKHRVLEVVRQAIRICYEKLIGERPPDLCILEKCAFVGCSAGPENLSASYKDYLTESLCKKHG